MFSSEFRGIFCLVLATLAPNPALQCSVENLPEFGDTKKRDRPEPDRFQAIVPDYRFQCSGKVIEWGACVQPGGTGNVEQYYIQFQVWEPVGSDRCYRLVDSNVPDDAVVAEEYLVPPDNGIDHCVVLTVREERQIMVQPGYVVGYYVDYFRKDDEESDNEDRDDGGVQWIRGGNMMIYYSDEVPRNNLEQYYAIGGSNPASCGFETTTSDRYTLTDSTSATPIISLSVVTTTMMPTTSTSSTQTDAVVVTSVVQAPSAPVAATPTVSLPPEGGTPLTESTTSLTYSGITPTSVPPPPPPPSVTSDDGTGVLVGAVVTVIIVVLAILVATLLIIIVLVKRRKNLKTAPSALNNPSYLDSTAIVLKQPQSSAAQYDYCGVPVPNGTEKEEKLYASLETPHYEMAQVTNSPPGNHQTYDYTAIYEDPTSQSYVSEVYSTGSIFDSAGTYVPTLDARTSYAVPQPTPNGKRYNTLQFFERDQVFWAPASNTLDLYEQLRTKRYREIDRSQIRVLEKIGSGQFGTVSKGVWVYRNETMRVAVKILNKSAGEGGRVKFLQEAAIMGQFYHPNIVRLHGVVTVGDPVLIVLDFMSNGDMKSYLDHLVIREEDQTSMPRQFLRFCREIAAGMAYLSKKSFVHRDLAARNILLDDHMSCKVGDFGMARDLADDTYYTSKGGKIPVKWTAPEALLYKKFSTASDVWSYGMVLYEIWSVGEKPFQSLNNTDVIARLQNRQCQPPPPGCPRAVYSLMVDCWNPEPRHRPTFEAVFRELRGPQEQLLLWSKQDKAAGRHLLQSSHSAHSFQDLQNKYISPST